MYPRKSVIKLNITHITENDYEDLLDEMKLYIPVWILSNDTIEIEHIHSLIKNILRHFISLK